MTVSSTTSRKTYAGNGSTTLFSTSPMIFFDSSDLVVYVTLDSDGTSETLVENTDYTVSGGDGSTGTLDLTGGSSPYGAPASGYTLVIQRDVPATQAADLVNNDGSDAEVIETALDKLTVLIQQLDGALDRVPQLADSDVSGADMTLPTPAASKLLGWNADADGLTNYAQGTITDSVVPTAFAETLLDDATAASARTTLGLTDAAAKGDVAAASAAGAFGALTVGADGKILVANSAAAKGLSYVAALNKGIYGLTYSNNGSDATNDIDIATGGAMDATGAYWMTLASGLTKRSDAAWAVGTNAGWLDTGAVGNSDYYIWLIARSDTGVVDSLCSLSSTAPTMPASYDFKRLIGWFKRVAGAIVAFQTFEAEGGGVEFQWKAPTADVALLNTLTTSGRTDAIKVPLNVSVLAHISAQVYDASGGALCWLYTPGQTAVVPVFGSAPVTSLWIAGSAAGYADMWLRTDATGKIGAIANVATVDSYYVFTLGFKWARRD